MLAVRQGQNEEIRDARKIRRLIVLGLGHNSVARFRPNGQVWRRNPLIHKTEFALYISTDPYLLNRLLRLLWIRVIRTRRVDLMVVFQPDPIVLDIEPDFPRFAIAIPPKRGRKRPRRLLLNPADPPPRLFFELIEIPDEPGPPVAAPMHMEFTTSSTARACARTSPGLRTVRRRIARARAIAWAIRSSVSMMLGNGGRVHERRGLCGTGSCLIEKKRTKKNIWSIREAVKSAMASINDFLPAIGL